MINHWNIYAKSWEGQSAPLRPSQLDLNKYTQHISVSKKNDISSALIMGVTPELFHLSKTMGLTVRCVDQSQKMINSVWPGEKSQAILGNWLNLTKYIDSPTIIICDGGFHLLNWDEQINFLNQFHNLNLIRSTLIFRFFLPPKIQLCCEKIFKALENKEIKSINYLKISLWHAIELNKNNQVKLSLIWDAISERAGHDVITYLSRLGFEKNSIDTLTVYKNNNSYYYFRDWNSIQDIFYKKAKLKASLVSVSDYIQGNQFPIVSFNKT